MSPENDPNDLAAIEKTLGGDKEAFGVLIDKYQNALFRLAWRLLGNRADAEDAAQEAFIRAYQNLADFKIGRSVYNWLYTIALNSARDMLRKRKIRGTFSIDAGAAGRPGETKREFPDKRSKADSQLKQNELKDRVSSIIGLLPEKYRTPITLYYFEEYSYKEISAAMNLSVDVIKVRLHRARDIIHNEWKKSCGNIFDAGTYT